jgi:hypothetical protein
LKDIDRATDISTLRSIRLRILVVGLNSSYEEVASQFPQLYQFNQLGTSIAAIYIIAKIDGSFWHNGERTS